MDSNQNNVDIPEIFRLINSGASINELVTQIHNDAKETEKVYLGLEELSKRGEESRQALREISRQNSRLRSASDLLYNNPEFNRYTLESRLRIKRFDEPIGTVDLVNRDYEQPQSQRYGQRLFDIAKRKGLTRHNSAQNFVVDYLKQKQEEQRIRFSRSGTQETGQIENEVINITNTFGSVEPIYLELIGPREALELRVADNPNFLLLGSYRQYQALEFSRFVEKINPNANPWIVEIDAESLDAIAEHKGSKEIYLVRGNFLEMPLQNNSMDRVYSNFIFRFVTVGVPGRKSIDPYAPENQEYVEQSMYNLFEQVYRILKPGGKYVVVEPHGNLSRVRVEDSIAELMGQKDLVEQGLIRSAEEAGFSVTHLRRPFECLFRPEISSSVIDSNGFPHYGNITLMYSPRDYVAMSLEKPI